MVARLLWRWNAARPDFRVQRLYGVVGLDVIEITTASSHDTPWQLIALIRPIHGVFEIGEVEAKRLPLLEARHQLVFRRHGMAQPF